MKHFTQDFKASDGLILRGQGWEPEETPRAAICLIHGHGEHTGRYAHAGSFLTQNGFALMGFDLRGHGRSDGRRGHTPSYDQLLDDISAMLAQVCARYPDQKVFLYGHSMGGNLVINYALRRGADLPGVIATGPWLRLAFEPPAIQVRLGRWMDKIYPSFLQSSGLELAALSHDESVVQAYANDPLVHDKVSARLFVAMYESGLWALAHAADLKVPMLLMHGTGDRLTSADASREFAERAGEQVTLRLWDGWYHEIHNEPDKASVFEAMLQWLNTRLQTA